MLICIFSLLNFMVSNLDQEYTSINIIYKYQKKYRATPKGKLASRKANERQTLKKMYVISNIIKCHRCDEHKFERLLVKDNKIICYSCKWERPIIFEEIIQ